MLQFIELFCRHLPQPGITVQHFDQRCLDLYSKKWFPLSIITEKRILLRELIEHLGSNPDQIEEAVQDYKLRVEKVEKKCIELELQSQKGNSVESISDKEDPQILPKEKMEQFPEMKSKIIYDSVKGFHLREGAHVNHAESTEKSNSHKVHTNFNSKGHEAFASNACLSHSESKKREVDVEKTPKKLKLALYVPANSVSNTMQTAEMNGNSNKSPNTQKGKKEKYKDRDHKDKIEKDNLEEESNEHKAVVKAKNVQSLEDSDTDSDKLDSSNRLNSQSFSDQQNESQSTLNVDESFESQAGELESKTWQKPWEPNPSDTHKKRSKLFRASIGSPELHKSKETQCSASLTNLDGNKSLDGVTKESRKHKDSRKGRVVRAKHTNSFCLFELGSESSKEVQNTDKSKTICTTEWDKQDSNEQNGEQSNESQSPMQDRKGLKSISPRKRAEQGNNKESDTEYEFTPRKKMKISQLNSTESGSTCSKDCSLSPYAEVINSSSIDKKANSVLQHLKPSYRNPSPYAHKKPHKKPLELKNVDERLHSTMKYHKTVDLCDSQDEDEAKESRVAKKLWNE